MDRKHAYFPFFLIGLVFFVLPVCSAMLVSFIRKTNYSLQSETTL